MRNVFLQVASTAILIGTALLVPGTTGSTDAADIDWNGNVSSSWHNELNVGNSGFSGNVNLSNGAMADVNTANIGDSGGGGLVISSGAVLATMSSRIGTDAGITGSSRVNGSGSVWNTVGTLTVGSSGQGQLMIEAGGQVNSGTGFAGAGSTSAGTITITGPGSQWSIAGNLLLGGGTFGDLGGTGIMHLQADGAATVGSEIRLYTNGTLKLSGGELTTPTISFLGGQFNWTSGTLHVESYPQALVNSGGTLAPGTSAGGTTILGNYTQQTGGTLEIEIGGALPIAEYDQVSITDIGVLDGQLDLALIDGFLPAANDLFTVLDALGGLAGAFDNVTSGQRLDTIDGIGSFLVHYGTGSPFDDDQIVLSAFQLVSADVDQDGDVDGHDFLLIQRTNPVLIPAWQAQYPSPISAVSAHGAAVPEPGVVALLLPVFLAFGFSQRHNRRGNGIVA